MSTVFVYPVNVWFYKDKFLYNDVWFYKDKFLYSEVTNSQEYSKRFILYLLAYQFNGPLSRLPWVHPATLHLMR